MSLRHSLKQTAKRTLKPMVSRFLFPTRRDLPLATWDLTRDAAGALCLHGTALKDVLAAHGSPLFVYDDRKLRQNVADFLAVPAGSEAGLECYFSYKTTPVPGVLRRIHDAGMGAEVISEYELWLALRMGVPGERIVLNGPGRSPAALRKGIEVGALIYVNHREEIPLLAALARSVGRRARVGVRVVVPGGWSGQFGETIDGGHALGSYRDLVAQGELFDVCALHAHLGGELSSLEVVEGFCSQLITFGAELQRELGVTLAIVDVGGSLGCPSARRFHGREQHLNLRYGADLVPPPLDDMPTIPAYAHTVVGTIEAACRTHGLKRPRIFAEPGRAVTSNAAMLLCSVSGLKATGADGIVHALLDAGVNIAEPMRSEFHQLFTLGRPAAQEATYRLVGPICTPMDTLLWSWRMAKLAPGDGLAIMDAGAYFVPFSTSFSFPQPGIVALDIDGEVTPLRRAEQFDDMVRRDT